MCQYTISILREFLECRSTILIRWYVAHYCNFRFSMLGTAEECGIRIMHRVCVLQRVQHHLQVIAHLKISMLFAAYRQSIIRVRHHAAVPPGLSSPHSCTFMCFWPARKKNKRARVCVCTCSCACACVCVCVCVCV